MKLTATIFISILFFFSFAAIPQQQDHVIGELLVQLKSGANLQSFRNSFNTIDLIVKEEISKDLKIYLCEYNTQKIEDDEVLYDIRQNSLVKVVQFNHFIQLRESSSDNFNFPNKGARLMPNDTRFNEQWHLHNTGQSGGTVDADIDAPEAWDFSTGGVTATGDSIVIAIVDGGCELTHSDLNYWYNRGEIPGNSIDDDLNGYIDDYRGWNAYDNNGNVPSNGHGTHVSGISGAKGNNGLGVSGVNWNCKIMPIGGSSGTEVVVVRAYSYVHKMRLLYNQTNGVKGAFIVATNASFGVDNGQPSNYPLWCGIYDSLGMVGVLNCGATANNNVNVDLVGDIPTACPSPYMISVTNTDRNDVKNSGAAYGLTTIDLGAPGTAVLSTYTSNGYSSLTGTSMATPNVTGAIGLIFAAANLQLMQAYKLNPSQGALVFRDFLFNNVDPNTSLQGKTVTGGRLNVHKAVLSVLAAPDTVAPTQITDLTVTDSTSNTLRIRWTTPMDTTQGGVVGYDIRRSTSPITDTASFNSAFRITFTGTPDSAGRPQFVTATGLALNTAYYFAVKSFDRWGNASLISNSPRGKTLIAPVISVSPNQIVVTVRNDSTYKDTVRISNISSGLSTLDYQVTLDNNIFPAGVLQYAMEPMPVDLSGAALNKDNPEVIHGSTIDGQGGPDAFGYKWIDSDEPNGPQYVWEDISSTGTLASTWTATGTFQPKDEGYSGPFNIGFNFKYYGVNQSQVYVGTNGFITFSPLTVNTYSNASLPGSALPNGIIAGFWDDLDGTTEGSVYYKQDGSRFIIQFQDWRFYSSTNKVTFQYILYPSGKIIINYKSMVGTLTSASVGLENQTGTIGLQMAYNSAYIHNNLCLKISADPDWLSTPTTSGTIYNGNTHNLVLTFKSEDYNPGEYTMDLKIASNDPVNPMRIVPVRMVIVAIPVELMSFTAEAVHNEVHLKWSTATETNNAGFTIEKRKVDMAVWTDLTFVKGVGTTVERVSYTFTDKDASSGKYLYRLKQIDFDGTYKYSDEVEVDISLPKDPVLYQNYPNPFNPVTQIEFIIPEKSEVTLNVYSSLGELIETLVTGTIEAGYHVIKFDAARLTSGTYIYQLKASGENGFMLTKKMLFIK